MKAIIVGGGKVGDLLCEELSQTFDEVTLIEINEKLAQKIIELYDIQGIVGSGANYNVLDEADAAKADLFIAVTASDEINILSCITAKQMGAKYTIARVRNPEYTQTKEFLKHHLGIDLMLNPEFEAAKQINFMLKYPSANKIETFGQNKVKMIEVTIRENSILKDKSLIESKNIINFPAVVCLVERKEEVIVPRGDYTFKVGDKVHITADDVNLKKFYKLLGEKENVDKKIRSTLIIGSGKLSYYLIELLKMNNIYIKNIEIDPKKADKISDTFPDIDVILADGSDRDVLIEEGIQTFDSCIALTGLDEENIIISLYANKLGVKKSIAKINRNSLTQIAEDIGLYSFITPKRIVGDIIAKHSKSLQCSSEPSIENIYRIANNKVELMEFKVLKETKLTNTPLKDLKINENILIGFIIRNNNLIFPSGDDDIRKDDNVIIINYQQNIKELDDILNTEVYYEL
ncbi:Trk system potassium transporter TrkA [Gemella sp. GH3]|uniref:Trk system potassium transporter TrkA n=1 Tax=unclassified Gemella TaxID=2624949 RepID=UPI0015D0659A|nr:MULTISPECIES: Trk system potassium transporter TrkA [unclassified Gemella]MBF0713987.1 Trk system potassium transporter TrkA [Gemella sp. GH3.1]NYS50939.1 Trk system potassium transporter TrkA [Gemella sp. GH3]